MILNGLFLFKIAVILLVRMWVEIILEFQFIDMGIVILLVRMWVEIQSSLHLPFFTPSSSSWGCELKYETTERIRNGLRHPPREDVSWNNSWVPVHRHGNCHPPREDVSWNTIKSPLAIFYAVILLVRMWVEMSRHCCTNYHQTVILLVRMWVEISFWMHL